MLQLPVDVLLDSDGEKLSLVQDPRPPENRAMKIEKLACIMLPNHLPLKRKLLTNLYVLNSQKVI